MSAVRLTLLFATLQLVAPAGGPLRVIRVVPESPANPLSEITVTFDRPVAGGLDEAVDPGLILSMTPAVAGPVEWRDPHTIRLTPAQPLEPGATYTLTVAPDFRAMDGSSLERPFTASFRVSPPSVIGGDPVHSGTHASWLPAQPVFRILLSAPVDLDRFAASAVVQAFRPCAAGTVQLLGVTQRRISDEDPGWFRWAGLRGPRPDSARDLRRVIELTTASPLPLDCGAILRLPAEAGEGSARLDWSFRTYGPLRVTRALCGDGSGACPTGPVRVAFSTPVRGDEIVRRVRIIPGREFTIRDTSDVSAEWILDARLEPRTRYAIVIEPGLTDVFGQTLGGGAVRPVATTGYAPTITYEYGRRLVERAGLRTLAVQHVNADTLVVTAALVPDTMEKEFLARSWGWEEPWSMLAGAATTRRIPVRAAADARLVTGVPLPSSDPRPGGTLLAVQVGSPALDSVSRRHRPIALLQVTDLGVHARIGADHGMVWVTGVQDGRPRAGVDVELRDARGTVRATARTDAHGLAELRGLRATADEEEECCWGFEGYVAARTADDRALVGINAYDPDLAPWRFGLWGAWERDREPAAAAVFTERGIYRPGESVRAKAIVRLGTLGSLRAPAGDSLQWIFRDRDGGVLHDTTVTLSAFGTADAHSPLSPDLPLGDYAIEIRTKQSGAWKAVDQTHYSVAEYRPPEFLVETSADEAGRMAGDTAAVTVSGRYLFGAPMANSPVDWNVRIASLDWGITLPGADGFTVGATANWWEDGNRSTSSIVQSGIDTLDATGRRELRFALPASADGRPATATLLATVTDANRQTVSAATSVRVHPASFYIGARTTGQRWFWSAREPVTIEAIAVRPDGGRVAGVRIDGVVVRREWHRVRRTRNGQVEEIGTWVADTVARCELRTGALPSPCSFTPPSAGSYTITLAAVDEAGRSAITSMSRWAAGPDWVPWGDETKLRMDIVTDKPTYDVGDTATVIVASPFTDAEAWVTIERERVLESRRIRITSGTTTLTIPITEALAPNAYVSVIVVRGRSAEPGPLDDPGRPAIRVGYARLRVLPAVKRLAVEVIPVAHGARSAGEAGTGRSSDSPAIAGPVEYEPGDTATIRLRVQDGAGRGHRAEVTLWAVDEGVLALTGYRLPDPVSLIYRERGVGLRLGSNLVSVAPQIPEGQKGRREAGGGGGGDLAGILRSRFQTTAFFLGSVVTNAEGEAVARAKLPDNLTTFRVMAVAVTAGDRYGSGESSFLVTRPLVARAALPRFVREGDRFAAGIVVNRRAGGEEDVEVEASAAGIRLDGRRKKNESVRIGRPADVRFDFRATDGDSARFTFAAASGRDRDAVRVAVPVRPAFHPLATTIAGALADTATVEFVLRDDVDPDRSRLDISFGSSVFAVIEGARRTLRVYPYYCSEQISSIALPNIALLRARRELADEVGLDALEREVANAVRSLTRRQTAAGSIGYWSGSDWSSPWLSAYAGRVLLEARAAGVAVDSAVLTGLADYLRRSLRNDDWRRTPVSWWYSDNARSLTERLAAVDFLSRLGRPDVPAENTLLQQASRMRWEDRVQLAEVLARRNERAPARALLEQAWAGVRVEGRLAVLPAAAHEGHYFPSSARPAARLLAATLLVEPAHPLVGPLAESLVERGRIAARQWNTQDQGWAVLALAEYEKRRATAGPVRVTIRSDRNALITRQLGAAGSLRPGADSSFTLGRHVSKDAQGRSILRLKLAAAAGPAATAGTTHFYATVHEVPKARPVDPVDRGIAVERWYERLDTRRPTVSVAEGELVRVRLRITVPGDRHFVVLDDPLPAGLEPVDLSLRTVAPPGASFPEYRPEETAWPETGGWWFGSWDSGLWSPFDHREMRDDRVVFSATLLWKGTYTASYIARAGTAGTFVAPPAHAEEMYNPGVNGRTGGSTFTVTRAAR